MGDQALNRIPLLFESVCTTTACAKGLLDLLHYQADWVEDTHRIMPVWEGGRPLAVVGAASTRPADADIENLVRFVAVAVRKLDQWELERRDAHALRTLLTY